MYIFGTIQPLDVMDIFILIFWWINNDLYDTNFKNVVKMTFEVFLCLVKLNFHILNYPLNVSYLFSE